MIPIATFYLLLMFQQDTVQIVGMYKTEQQCLETLSTAPPKAITFCMVGKAVPPKAS
jgi:hypothetical protein